MGAEANIPAIIAKTRYIDDIIDIFPGDIPGPEALKQSNGGPYPDSIGIKSEHRGKRVQFLDL